MGVEDLNKKELWTYIWIVGCTVCFGAASFVLLFIWIFHISDGVSWNGPNMRNYHFLFMPLGMVLLLGLGAMVFRIFYFLPKIWLKRLHAAIMFSAIGLTCIGLAAKIDLDSASKQVTTLHSWIGFGAFSLFLLQYFSGFSIFLLPFAGIKLRGALLPIHRYFGVAILVLATANTFFHLSAGWDAGDKERYVRNFLGVGMVLFVMGVTCIVTNSNYRRTKKA